MGANLNLIYSVCVFLAVFPALWISGRIILRNVAGEDPTTQLFLWLALGGFIFNPLADLLRYFLSFLSLIIPPLWNFTLMTVSLGMGPFLAYSTIILILGIAVYGLSYSYARRLIAQGEFPLFRALQLENWELGLALLGVISLLNRMVRGIVEGFVSINLNDLASRLNLSPQKGFWISWLIALLILLATLFAINERLSRSE
jgi:hypothetical protein